MGVGETGARAIGPSKGVDVSIVMPCLDEARCLPACIANAQEALARLSEKLGLEGEILVADNGSVDGSQALARALGVEVVLVPQRGYGAALCGGALAARGRYIVMGDADGSYDFCDAIAMVEALTQGADLCMGSRFKGEIKPGAMPWKNRFIGNPILTGILNLLFGTRLSDAHCGLRALSRGCFLRLGLRGTGMEFASEMIIKAALKGETIAEVPATLHPDLRDRPPHLRPWRDGWRHLRYLMMLSPTWVFALPAAGMAASAVFVLANAGLSLLQGTPASAIFGNYWTILAGAMLSVGHLAAILAAATHLYGVRENYRRVSRWTTRLARWVSLETMLTSGLLLGLCGLGVLASVFGAWSANHFETFRSVLPAVCGTTLMTIGAQNAMGGFLLAVVGGNEAAFLKGVSMLKDLSPSRAQPTGADTVQPVERPKDRHVA